MTNIRKMSNIQTKDAMNTKIAMRRQTLRTQQVDEHQDCTITKNMMSKGTRNTNKQMNFKTQ
jgi:hypothetical protein